MKPYLPLNTVTVLAGEVGVGERQGRVTLAAAPAKSDDYCQPEPDDEPERSADVRVRRPRRRAAKSQNSCAIASRRVPRSPATSRENLPLHDPDRQSRTTTASRAGGRGRRPHPAVSRDLPRLPARICRRTIHTGKVGQLLPAGPGARGRRKQPAVSRHIPRSPATSRENLSPHDPYRQSRTNCKPERDDEP
jgi:hypothetical protein